MAVCWAGVTGKVVLADTEPDTMELLVGWMYGRVNKALGLCQAVDLYVASDKYAVLDLQQACVEIIAHRVASLSAMIPSLVVYKLWQFATAIGSDAVVQVRNTLRGCARAILACRGLEHKL